MGLRLAMTATDKPSKPPRTGALTTRRLAAVAGLGYVVGVGIENMNVLQTPTLGSSLADIRSAFDDHALAVVTSFAGALAQLSFCVFVAATFVLLRAAERGRRRLAADRPDGRLTTESPDEPWAVVALAGGLAGPVIAATGLASEAILVANGGVGLSDEMTRSLFDVQLIATMVAGPFLGLFLIAAGVVALRSLAFPARLAWLGFVAAAPLVFSPIAAFTGEHALGVGVTVSFGLATLWVFLLSLWLAIPGEASPATFLRRAAFLVLVLAAGLVGIALVAVPASTATFFSWGLAPAPLAAFAGGVYLGSAAVYAVGLPKGSREVRGLLIGAVVLSVSVLIVTLAHLEVFDFDRLQAWAWLILFAAFSTIMVAVSAIASRAPELSAPAHRTALPQWARTVFAGIAVVLGALAIALWLEPTGLSTSAPFELSPLGGSFAGSWIALLATLAGWAAIRNRLDEARLPALALIALPGGALIAGLRTMSDLDPGVVAATYLTVLGLLAATGIALLTASRPATAPLPQASGRESRVARPPGAVSPS
jgi:hypothetical protein